MEITHYDVTGQPNGPHPDEQNRVDQEQRDLMAQMKVERDKAEAQERANNQAKLERAEQAKQKQIDRDAQFADLQKRVEALEGKA